MELEDMEQFVNVAMAIQNHDVDLPAGLIEYVNRLESRLGAELLRREGGQLVLTEQGDELAEESLRSLRLAASAVDAARSRARSSIGTLRVGFAEAAMGPTFHQLIRRFNEARPQAPLELVDFTHEGMIDALETARVDVGFSINSDTPVTIDKWIIERQNFVAVMTPDHPSANVSVMRLSDLPRLRTIEYCSSMNNVLADEVGPVMTGGGLGRVKVDGPRNAILAAAAGLGVALLPSGVADLVRHTRLHMLPLEPDVLGVDIVAMQRIAASDPLVDELLQRESSPQPILEG